MSLHLFPVTIRGISPPIHGLLSRPTTEYHTLPTVIYFHGLNGTRNQPFQDKYVPLAEALQARNMNVLSIDLREHGERRSNKESTGADNFIKAVLEKENDPFAGAEEDIKRVVEFLIEKKIALPGQISIMGLSWGALFAMMSLQVERHLRCAVALLPVGKITSLLEFRAHRKNKMLATYEPTVYLKNLAPKPLLMITTENDKRSDPAHASALYHQLAPAYAEAGKSENLAYVMLTGAGHAYDNRMTPMILDWFDRHMQPDDKVLRIP